MLCNTLIYSFITALLIIGPGLRAQTPDSTHLSPGRSGGKAVSVFLAPTLLIGAGIATMDDRGWYSSYDAYLCIQRNYPDFHTNLDNFLFLMPAMAVYGLNLAGVEGNNSFTDRSIAFLAALSLTGLSTGILKGATNIWRPDGSSDRSFPSSHTALAFMSATFLHEEYGQRSIWYSIAGYSLATTTGVIRMLKNDHWMSDVLVGAGLGILSTKIVYWVYPHIKAGLNEKPGKQAGGNLSLLPYAAPDHYGLFLQYTIR